MIRKAHIEEADQLNQLIAKSAHYLSQDDYTQKEIDGAMQSIFGIDNELIKDQTYVIEHKGLIVACGGWSRRKTS